MDIGFIGLGQMGGAIAERLVAPDISLHVFDTSADAVGRLTAKGAKAASSAVAVAAAAPVVFACLPSPAISEATANALAASPGQMRLYVEMSTIGRRCVMGIEQTLTAKGITVVDCPVSGGPVGARAGSLATLAAGPCAALDELRPLLARIGSATFEIGDKVGLGQMMKLVNNMVAISNLTIAHEALVLGAKGGLDADMMVNVIQKSTGNSRVMHEMVPKAILPRSFDFGARLAVPYKDLVLGLAEADSLEVPMWVGEQVRQLWRFAMTQGMGEQDYSTLITMMEGWAGAEVRGKAAKT